ncbi:MAG: fibronectin type III domain-containing protein [Acidobacteria bacterium]|nr:MAG: fibronectin type III domain-containing protein [Acidobacteriota bacterium]
MHFTFSKYFCAIFIVVTCFTSIHGAIASLTWYPNTESDIVGYKVYRTLTPGNGYVPLTQNPIASTSFDDSAVIEGSTYYYTITAVNSSWLESGFSEEVGVTIPTQNRTPSANAGPDKTVPAGAYLTATASGADPDGDPVIFSWSQVSGPAVTVEAAGSSMMSFRAPLASASLQFRVTVSDGRGGLASDNMLVQVVAGVNYPPVADGGVDRMYASGQKAKLIGTGSDPNGDKITFAWQQRSGPTVTLQDSATPIASFTAPTVTTTTTMIFRLTVKDPYGASNYDDVRVFVSPTDSAGLIIPGSTQGIHPLLDNNSITASFTNLGTGTSAVELTSLDSAGNRLAIGTTLVKASFQESVLVSSLTIPAGSVLRAKSTPNIKNVLTLTSSDQLRTDSLGTEFVPASVLHFPAAGLNSPEASLLVLANPDSAQSVDVTLRLLTADGTVLREVVTSLVPNAAKQGSLTSFLGTIQATGQDYYLRLSGSRLVEAFLIQADQDSLAIVPPQILNPSSRLWIPHFVVGLAGEDTDISLVNEAPTPIRIRATAYAATGQLATKEATIAGKGLLNARVSSLFPLASLLAGQSSASGHITLEVIYPDPSTTGQKPPLAGSIRLLGAGRKAKAVLPLVSVGRRDTAFLQISQETASNTFTGLVLKNTGTAAASVRLDAFSRSGVLAASKTLSIPAGARVVNTLNSSALFGSAFQQVGGWLKVTSSEYLVGFALIGDNSGEFYRLGDGQKP